MDSKRQLKSESLSDNSKNYRKGNRDHDKDPYERTGIRDGRNQKDRMPNTLDRSRMPSSQQGPSSKIDSFASYEDDAQRNKRKYPDPGFGGPGAAKRGRVSPPPPPPHMMRRAPLLQSPPRNRNAPPPPNESFR